MKFNNSLGQTSLRVVVILIIVILLAAVIVYFGLRFAGNIATQGGNNVPEVIEPPQAVYDTRIGDVEVKVLSAKDMGNFLTENVSGYNQTVRTTEKFIKVTIQAQNKGKINTALGIWGMGDIIDDEERVFNQIGNAGYYFLPNPDFCGAILKPEFSPITCVRIFEVAKDSNNLKVNVYAAQDRNKVEPVLLDLSITR